MILKLYKTVFWISFAVMLIGSTINIFQVFNGQSKCDLNDQYIYRTSKNLDVKFLPDIGQLEESLILQDKQSLYRLFFVYDTKQTAWIAMLIGQFLAIIVLKKWLNWLLQKG